MSNLGSNTPEPNHTYEDNAVTIVVSNNEWAARRILNVDLHYFSILDWIKNCDMILKPISSANNYDDELDNNLWLILRGKYSGTLLWK